METNVKIEWDQPDEKQWLNTDNIEMALATHCSNTKFKVSTLDPITGINKRNLEFIGRLVDAERSRFATRLINMEAFVNTITKEKTGSIAINTVHMATFKTWVDLNNLAEDLDTARGINYHK